MGTHALTIVKEEFEALFEAYPGLKSPRYEPAGIIIPQVRDRILDRIERECVDQPEPENQASDRECSLAEQRDLRRGLHRGCKCKER